MSQKNIHIAAPVGVIGSGSFGITIASLLAENVEEVLVYARREEVLEALRAKRGDYEDLPNSIKPTDDLQEIADRCQLIFPAVPSNSFRSMMQDLGPLLRPSHFLIHGTKGLDVTDLPQEGPIQPRDIKTMSEVIEQESIVKRIGCLSGPNLSSEIMAGQPAATLLASNFTEVIRAGQQVLRSPRFQVYGTHDIIGAELAGALKNVIALAAGLLGGKGLGMNIWALLVTRGLSEMIHIGKAIGTDVKAFLGVAGIGDLVATASSTKSRNYTAGKMIAQGATLQDILDSEMEVEGLRTLETTRKLYQQLDITSPIFEMTYRVIFKGMDLDRAIHFLMTYPYEVDVDFL